MFRTKTCGELRAANVGETVTLSGWVDSARDHSGVFFVNIRDRYGKTQTVFNVADGNPELFELVKTLHNEDVVQIEGEVLARPEGLINSDMPTGEIEVKATKLVVLNRSEPVPFLPSAPEVPSEEMRLKYRYIDLRRPEMQRVLTLRHRITKTLRDYFDECYLSYKCKMMKPAPEFFRLLIEREKLDAGEILFVDDGQVNIDVAQGLGIRTMLVENNADWTHGIYQHLQA